MTRVVRLLTVLALLGSLAWAPSAGADAFFPGGEPPPTQISRDLSLQKAAQAGLVNLQAKGGPVGDAVSLELQGKQLAGPITVTVRAEFRSPARVPAEAQQKIRDALPTIRDGIQADLNSLGAKTRTGDPIRFKLEWEFRAPDAAARASYHQILLINPNLDLNEPNPTYRSRISGPGVPNERGTAQNAIFNSSTFNTKVLSHEFLHLAGLQDHYTDYYHVGGKDYPLPRKGMTDSALAQFARNHRPPLRPPPAGKAISKGIPGTDKCDIMGEGERSDCRKIDPEDLDFLTANAGVQVTAEPGDLLLNKDDSKQDFGVGYRTVVFAAPGATTTANGVSVFCIDHTAGIPFDEGFDVGPPAATVPGDEDLARLLTLSGRQQTVIDQPLDGMLGAVWNVTDHVPLFVSGDEDAARALLVQAGVTEDGHPDGLPKMADPNGAAPRTGAVRADGTILPAVPATAAPTAPVAPVLAQLSPNRVRQGRDVRSGLLVVVPTNGQTLKLKLERRVGRRWRTLRALRGRSVAGLDVVLVPLRLGRLKAGSARVVVSVGATLAGKPAVRRLALRVTR